MLRSVCTAAVLTCAVLPAFSLQQAAEPYRQYGPTLESLDRHPVPAWFADAKLGIFVHWGLYSVPGWAPLHVPKGEHTSKGLVFYNMYSEWYANSMQLPGSPTWKYHRAHFGADFPYYDFAKSFEAESRQWDPDAWASQFAKTGARYVVFTTKHHDGFTLWPSEQPHPGGERSRRSATRDFVGELTQAVRAHGMKMGVYYSGGYDWSVLPGPITDFNRTMPVEPQSAAYGAYVRGQYEELIARYKPDVLWNDIDFPATGQPLELEAAYYNAVPEGVINDRFSITHADYETPEYSGLTSISPKQWEECRGLGRSFGFNRAEGEAETIAPDKLIYLLADVVSKNGNLLLDVGPEADGTIPPPQLDRLEKLGAWLAMNGEAIYGTHPWLLSEAHASDGTGIRFTTKGKDLYAILLGRPKTSQITLHDLPGGEDSSVEMLGVSGPLASTKSQNANGWHDLTITLPAQLPGRYAYVLHLRNAL